MFLDKIKLKFLDISENPSFVEIATEQGQVGRAMMKQKYNASDGIRYEPAPIVTEML